jgi:hypothetical protein
VEKAGTEEQNYLDGDREPARQLHAQSYNKALVPARKNAADFLRRNLFIISA